MSKTTEMALKQLGAADRKLLQVSVHMNPILVANVDDHYSFREQAAIAKSVRQLMSEPSYQPLIPLAGHDTVSEASLRVLLEEHSRDVDGYLEKIKRLLASLPDDVVRSYRDFTLYAIVNVAEASRDGLFGLVGQRISDKEKALIRRMIDILGLEPTEEHRTKLGM